MNPLKQILIIGCVFSVFAKAPDYAKHAQDTAKAFSLIAQKESGITPIGSGGFYTNKKVDSLYIDFEIKKRLSPEEAKALLTTTVDHFVAYVNQNEALRPFLQTYPITPQQISVSIGFIDEKRNPLSSLSQIHLFDGTIYYSTFNPSQKEVSLYQKELYTAN